MRPILQLGLLVVVVVAAAATVTRAEEQPNPVTEAEVTSNSNGPTEEPEEEVQVGMVGAGGEIFATQSTRFYVSISSSKLKPVSRKRGMEEGMEPWGVALFVCLCAALYASTQTNDMISSSVQPFSSVCFLFVRE